MTPGALSGLTVVDVSQVMAGPFCTQLLADMGAEVIKVERPSTGDQARLSMGYSKKGDDSTAFLALNRNKKSIVIDLKSLPGQELVHRLVSRSDVFVENFRPGVAARLGLDYPVLSELNPRLVYASISGFGQSGPYVDRPGYDLIAQAMSGIMSVTGEPGAEPTKSGVPIADLSAGMLAAFGIVSALHWRDRSGHGQHVDVSLLDAAFALSIWETAELWSTGRPPAPMGSAHRFNAPYQALRARDGYLVVGANNERQWRSLCTVLKRVDLLANPRVVSNQDRLANRKWLADELTASLQEKDVDEWVAELLAAGVPAGPIHDYEQAAADPQLRERGMVTTVQHPVEGETRVLGVPVRLSTTPGSVRSPAPLLGQHSTQVLRNLGLPDDEIERLLALGVVE